MKVKLSLHTKWSNTPVVTTPHRSRPTQQVLRLETPSPSPLPTPPHQKTAAEISHQTLNTDQNVNKNQRQSYTQQEDSHLKARRRLTTHREWAFQGTQRATLISKLDFDFWVYGLVCGKASQGTSVYSHLSLVHGKSRGKRRRNLVLK